jgi:multiple sugar transport system substrate-binding protein
MKKLVALGVAVLLATAGCSGGDDEAGGDTGKTTLTVALWNYASTPEFKSLVEGFEAEHSDIDVQPVDILADNYPDKVTTMLAGGDTTDVITMKNVIDYARYGTRGQLQSLTDEAKALDKDKYSGANLDAFDLDGEYYALPYRRDFWVLYYNRALIKDDVANLTWQQYAELAKKTTTGTGGAKVYGTYQHTWRSVVQAISAAQTGGNLLGADYGFMKDQYTMTLGLQQAGATLPWSQASTQKVSYNTMFSTGKAAMLPMGTWYAAQLLANVKAGKTKVDWGIAPMPQVGAGGKITTFGSPTAFAVNKKAKHAKAAKEFVTWAAGPKGAATIAKIGVVPAYHDDAIMNAYFGLPGMPNDATAKKAFQPDTVTLEMPVSDKSSDVDAILMEEHQLIMVGDKSVDAGLAEMGKRVKAEVG